VASCTKSREQGEYEKAISDYNKAIAGNVADRELLLRNRARAHAGLQEFEKAAVDYAKALELAPKSASAMDGLGNCYAEMGQYDKAEEHFRQAIELSPNDRFSRYGLAMLQLARGSVEEFWRVVEENVNRLEEDATAEIANSLAWQTVILPDAPLELAGSLELAETAVSADTNSIYFVGTLAAVYYRLGDSEKAVAVLNALLDSDGQPSKEDRPTGTDARKNVAWNGLFYAMALHEAGRTEESKNWLEKATGAIEELTREKNADRSVNVEWLAWYDRLELDLFLREATKLIAGSPGDAPEATEVP
jgi:tetratricopeptide (TPR) repeat protein